MRSFRIIIILVAFWIAQSESYALCAVDAGVDPALSTYIRETTEKAQTIESSLPNICSTHPTPVASMNQVWSSAQKARSEVPLMNSIIKDFSYNILTITRFEASQKTKSQGELLYNLEKNTLMPTLDRLATKCQLGGQAEQDVVSFLTRNNDLQDYFRDVVIGSVGTAPTDDPVKTGILQTYRPENNNTCSDSGDMSTMIAKLMKKTEGFGRDITIAKENWQESIALMRGTSNGGVQKYQELQASLLRAELSRQGLSQNAIAQMMKNLACAQAEGNESLNTDEQARAQEVCTRTYILGYEKLKIALESLKWKARTTDEYIALRDKAQYQITPEVDILQTYTNLTSTIMGENNAEAITNKIITDLISMHTSLVGLNTVLERRIPKMQDNCQKGNPGITGGCRLDD